MSHSSVPGNSIIEPTFHVLVFLKDRLLDPVKARIAAVARHVENPTPDPRQLRPVGAKRPDRRNREPSACDLLMRRKPAGIILLHFQGEAQPDSCNACPEVGPALVFGGSRRRLGATSAYVELLMVARRHDHHLSTCRLRVLLCQHCMA